METRIKREGTPTQSGSKRRAAKVRQSSRDPRNEEAGAEPEGRDDKEWDNVDRASADSFPASDPPSSQQEKR